MTSRLLRNFFFCALLLLLANTLFAPASLQINKEAAEGVASAAHNSATINSTPFGFPGLYDESGTGLATSPVNFFTAKDIQQEAGISGQVARTRPNGGAISGEKFGMKGDGITDNTRALTAAVNKASLIRGTVLLGTGTFAFSAPITSSVEGVSVRGVSPEATRLKRISGGTERTLLKHTFDDWTFENLTVDGNTFDVSQPHEQSVLLIKTRNVTFRNVTFRNLSSFYTKDVTGLKFENCRFYGTRTGAMESGTRTPSPSTRVRYANGSILNRDTSDVAFDRCYFHFLAAGLTSNLVGQERSKGLKITNSTFRADWWNQPYVIAKFKATGWKAGGYLGGGDLQVPAGAVPDGIGQANPFALTVEIGAGTGWKSSGAGSSRSIILTKSLPGVRIGDSFETLDGKRAEVVKVEGATQLKLSPWESIDTFEPAIAPVASGGWVINRYYAAFPYPKQVLSDQSTSVRMYGEFYNPFDGERFSNTGLSYAGREVRVFAKKIYAGVHLSRNFEDVYVNGNLFRGSWADQLSMRYAKSVRAIGNRFEYGGDEGITATKCEGAVISDNRFFGQGASAIYSTGDRAKISGNKIENWGGVNGFVGAYDFAGRGSSLTNNSAYTPQGSGYLARIGIRVIGPSEGAVIAGNVENGRDFSVKVEPSALPSMGQITIKNARNIFPLPPR